MLFGSNESATNWGIKKERLDRGEEMLHESTIGTKCASLLPYR